MDPNKESRICPSTGEVCVYRPAIYGGAARGSDMAQQAQDTLEAFFINGDQCDMKAAPPYCLALVASQVVTLNLSISATADLEREIRGEEY